MVGIISGQKGFEISNRDDGTSNLKRKAVDSRV